MENVCLIHCQTAFDWKRDRCWFNFDEVNYFRFLSPTIQIVIDFLTNTKGIKIKLKQVTIGYLHYILSPYAINAKNKEFEH